MRNLSTLAWLIGASFFIPDVSSAQVVFTGSGTGAIPDGGPINGGPADWGPPLLVTFNVSGLAQQIDGVSLSLTMNHSYLADLDVQLFGPGGHPENPSAQGFVIFSRVSQQVDQGGFNILGSSWRLGSYHLDIDNNKIFDAQATYVFSDGTSGNLWSAAGFNILTGTVDNSTGNLTAGGYRTSVAGPWDVQGNTHGGNHNAGQLTSFATDSGLVGLTPAQADGVWTLRIRDGTLGDMGSVSTADLTITPVPEPAQYALVAALGLIGFAGCRRFSLAKA